MPAQPAVIPRHERHGGPNRARVLIVGDDVSVTDAFARILRLSGSEVWACASAAEGLALARAHLPQAVIIDLRTTLAAGLRLARAVRGIPGVQGIPLGIVVVTGDYWYRPEPDELVLLGVEVRYRPVWLSELIDIARDVLAVAVAR